MSCQGTEFRATTDKRTSSGNKPSADAKERERAWNAADTKAADRQGWSIFATGRGPMDAQVLVDGKPYGHRPYELQRYDEMEVFADDVEAQVFVRTAAQNGNPLAMRALAFLEKYSPAEYAAVMEASTASAQ